MAAFLSDTFTEASTNTLLDAHTGETGATWTKHGSSGSGTAIIASATDRLRINLTGGIVLYYASGAPAGADYEVSAPILAHTTSNASAIGVVGRLATGADTYYAWYHDNVADLWNLVKVVAGTPTVLATYAQTLVISTTYVAKLEMVGSAIKGYVDAVERASVTDSAITAAGKAGIRGDTGVTSNSGLSLADIAATDLAGAANVPCGTSAATASATLALSTTTTVPLGSSPAAASTTLALTAPTQVPLAPSAATSAATLAASATTRVPLGTSAATASTSLDLTAPTSGEETEVPCNPSGASSSASLSLTGPPVVAGTASAQATTTLSITATSRLTLLVSGQSSAMFLFRVPAGMSLNAAHAVCAAILSLSVPLEEVGFAEGVGSGRSGEGGSGATFTEGVGSARGA